MEEAKSQRVQRAQIQAQTNSVTTFEFQRILKIVILLSVVYLVLVTVSIPTLAIVAVILACVSLLVRMKLAEFKEKGPENFSPKLRELLFEKSIFDIYSDIIYFPTISKIIGAFIRPMLVKPPPSELKHSFQKIHPKAQQIISTKGIINIFPQKVRAICQKQDEPLPPVVRDWNWIHAQKYKSHEQVHEDTLKKKIIERVDSKVNWTTLSLMAVLVAFGIKKMNPQRAQRMLIQNGCFAGVLIVILIGVIKISRQLKHRRRSPHLEIEARVVQIEE